MAKALAAIADRRKAPCETDWQLQSLPGDLGFVRLVVFDQGCANGRESNCSFFTRGAPGLVEFSYGILRTSGNSLTQSRGESLIRENATIYVPECVKRVKHSYRKVWGNFVRSIGKHDGSYEY
jgi:hypothetical protein